MLRLALTFLLGWCLVGVAGFGEPGLLRPARHAADDLEIEIKGRVGFVPMRALLGLPQVSATVFGDENFTELPAKGVTVQGVLLSELLARLGVTGSWVEAICSDRYAAPFPKAYVAAHRPILVLKVDGEPVHAWARRTGQYDPGPYLIAYDHFVPSFRVLAHEDRAQVPSQVVRLRLVEEREVLEAVAPRGDRALDVAVVAGGRIATQSCLRCHNREGFGGTKARRSFTALGEIAVRHPEEFAAYVRAPQKVNAEATMPANPQYDDETLRALARYFAGFAEMQVGGGLR